MSFHILSIVKKLLSIITQKAAAGVPQKARPQPYLCESLIMEPIGRGTDRKLKQVF